MAEKDSVEIRKQGWRQGDLITGEAIGRILTSSFDSVECLTVNPVVLLILSQDCDLVAMESKEPYIELIAGKFISTVDPTNQHGRNPRVIHIQDTEKNISFCIHDRFRIRKNDFCATIASRTDSVLSDSARRMVVRWVGKRYTRSAYPDEFNKRLSINRKVQDDLCKAALSKKVIAVLLDVSDKELATTEDYEIKILIGVDGETTKEECFQIEKKYEEAFTTRGILILDIAVREELDITLRELRTYKMWDREYRSYPESSNNALPPL